MEKLFLIDAYALIYRSYYAFIKSPRINSKGLNTSAILGFMNTLHEILQKEKPTHIGVAFDVGQTFRDEAFPQYKAQREETPEDIRRSVPIIKQILEAMRIPVLSAAGFEADDVIGTLALEAGSKGIETYMLTPDKDYGQLVRDNVFIFRPRHGGGYEKMGPREVCQKYGIASTAQVIDLLALMGDSADNFPGCPGVGEKTAVKLLEQFGSIESLLSRTSEIKGKLREKVEAARADIEMSRFLATIRTDVPVSLDLPTLSLKQPDEEKLREIFADLEFKTLLNKFLNKAETVKNSSELKGDFFGFFPPEGQDAPKNSTVESLKTVPHRYHLIEKEEDAREFLAKFSDIKKFSFDTETTSTHPIDAELVGMSFCHEAGEAWYIAVPHDRTARQRLLDQVRPLLCRDDNYIIGQNLKYDIEVMRRHGIEMRGTLFDTMIAHYLLQPELRHNMDDMALALLNYQTVHIEELIGPKGKGQKSMRELPPSAVYEYACEDADVTLRLYSTLLPKLKEQNCEQLFREIEMPVLMVLTEMETNGARLDTAELIKTERVFKERLRQSELKIYELAGYEFNISSPKQVGETLFEKLRISDKAKKTKTGQYVTSEEALLQLRHAHPIVEEILSYRGLKKLLGTYVEALPKLINARTGRIHTSYNQAVTATGRLSSSDPNLQNIPVRGEDGKEIRRCFIAEPGCEFMSADYSQIELRVMAHLSGDEHMTSAFRSGLDIHAATAARIYHKAVEEVSRDERGRAKRANFGIIYGITAFGLAEQLEISRGEAKQLIDGYFESFPQVQAYMRQAIDNARATGYTQTLFGRRRYLPDIASHNATVRAFAERNAINAPIQGTAADIIKIAMVRIYKRMKQEGLHSKMILQVHDELNFSVPPSEHETMERLVREEMEGACSLRVPLTVDIGWGSNWLEAH